MNLDLGGVGKDAVLDANKVNNGVWTHLLSAETDPETGQQKPCYLNGDERYPQRALVRSYRCQAIKDAEEAKQKKGFVKIRLAKKKDRDNTIAESSILSEKERFTHLLIALENVGSAPGIQHILVEDAKALHGMSEYDSWVQQIRETAYDDSEYAATSETEAGNGSPSTTVKPTAETAKTAATAPAEAAT